jgi:hypothetical protein
VPRGSSVVLRLGRSQLLREIPRIFLVSLSLAFYAPRRAPMAPGMEGRAVTDHRRAPTGMATAARRPDLVTMNHQDPNAVPGSAIPPSRPAPGRGRPRAQVEPGSLGSGRPPLPPDAASADPGGVATAPLPDLSDAQWAALRRLADAPHVVVDRWPVGRAVAQALLRRGLVHACSEWVWLTRAGLMALDAQARQGVHTRHSTATAVAADQAGSPTPPTTDTDRRAEPTRPVRRPAGGELPPGVLLRAARAGRP